MCFSPAVELKLHQSSYVDEKVRNKSKITAALCRFTYIGCSKGDKPESKRTAIEEEDQDLETCTREMQVHTIFCSHIWSETEPSATRKGNEIQLDSKKKKASVYSSKRRRGADEKGRFLQLASQS